MEKIKNNIVNSDDELKQFEEDLVQPNKEEPYCPKDNKENINDKEEKK